MGGGPALPTPSKLHLEHLPLKLFSIPKGPRCQHRAKTFQEAITIFLQQRVALHAQHLRRHTWNSQPANALSQLQLFVPGTQQGISQTLFSTHPESPTSLAPSEDYKESEGQKQEKRSLCILMELDQHKEDPPDSQGVGGTQ